MAYYGPNYINDDKVWLDLYIDDLRKDIILGDKRFYFSNRSGNVIKKGRGKDKGRLVVYDDKGVRVTNWKLHNHALWSACERSGLYRDILSDMLYAHGLTIGEISVVCVTNYSTMYSNMRYWLRLTPEQFRCIQTSNSAMRVREGGMPYDSKIEQIIGSLLDLNGIVFSKHRIRYSYKVDDEVKYTNTIPDFIFDKVVFYLDGYAHDLPSAVERDARQVIGLTGLGYRVVRVRTEHLIDANYEILIRMIQGLVCDISYDIQVDLDDIKSLYDADRACKRLYLTRTSGTTYDLAAANERYRGYKEYPPR